jgi:hypothetical protein
MADVQQEGDAPTPLVTSDDLLPVDEHPDAQLLRLESGVHVIAEQPQSLAGFRRVGPVTDEQSEVHAPPRGKTRGRQAIQYTRCPRS